MKNFDKNLVFKTSIQNNQVLCGQYTTGGGWGIPNRNKVFHEINEPRVMERYIGKVSWDIRRVWNIKK